MVIIIKKETPEAAIRQLLAQLAALHVKGGCVAGEEAILLPLVGETWRLDPNALQALPFVREVRRLTPPYRLAGCLLPPPPRPIRWWPRAMPGSAGRSASSPDPAPWSPRLRSPPWPGQ